MKNLDLVHHKKIYFAISAITGLIGLAFLIIYGLNFSIDFSGGSQFVFSYPQNQEVQEEKIEQAFQSQNISIQRIRNNEEQNQVVVRTTPLDQATKNKVSVQLKNSYPDLREQNFETVGPTIGGETKQNAVKAVVIASAAIMLYIAFAFREVSKPVSSWKFGASAIIALVHDILITVGVFAILGHYFDVEIDPLFITALLTVMGFSVHDTIVVFDRIRENLKRRTGNEEFSTIVNNSLLETLTRSLNTTLTVIIVLVALILFGGQSIFWFVVALLVGIVSGTYSSIFVAAQLLVAWNEWDQKRKLKKNK